MDGRIFLDTNDVAEVDIQQHMDGSISHVLTPEELAEWGTCAPKYDLVVLYSVFSKHLKNIFLAGFTVDTFNWTLVQIGGNLIPCTVVNQFCQINLTHHGGHDMTVLQMEIIVRTIEVCGHHSNVVCTVLEIVRFAHFQTGNLGDGVFLVSIFQRGCQQTILFHGLRRILRIDAGGTQEQQFLHAMGIGFRDDITLDLHVHHDEVGTVE